jgi:hypothetical protein
MESNDKPKELNMFSYDEEFGTIAYKDELMTVLPLTCEEGERRVYSYVGIPVQTKGTFLPQVAKALGCNPRDHFKILADGQDVTLTDGTVIKSA